MALLEMILPARLEILFLALIRELGPQPWSKIQQLLPLVLESALQGLIQ